MPIHDRFQWRDTVLKHNLSAIANHIVSQYTLPVTGIHGIAHWARVFENGMRLANSTGANVELVGLFALFHDSRRFNESTDPNHGQRGADFAAEVRGELLQLSDSDFDLLNVACAGHSIELTHENITIQTCWDADRLDLGRVGIQLDPAYLSTGIARHPETILWADERARKRFSPEMIETCWKIDL